MSWNYQQSTGELSRHGFVLARGFSGRGLARNSGSMEGVQSLGAIPCGRYLMLLDGKSPRRIDLQPVGHNARNRRCLHLCSPSQGQPTLAPEGGVVLPLSVIPIIFSSGLRYLTVST